MVYVRSQSIARDVKIFWQIVKRRGDKKGRRCAVL